MSGPFYGKYRGKVVNPIDPLGLGRLQVQVPAVYGDAGLNWALPCLPYAGSQTGFLAMPPVDANVWVEFEAGDKDSPIWSGCFWSSGEAPSEATTAPFTKVFATDLVTITLTDVGAEPGIEIKTKDGARLAITATGIVIDNGKGAKIEMRGPNVSVNGGALEVT